MALCRHVAGAPESMNTLGCSRVHRPIRIRHLIVPDVTPHLAACERVNKPCCAEAMRAMDSSMRL